MNQNKKLKGGAEKQRLKRQAELKVVAKDPKQKKLTFYSSSSSSTFTSLTNSAHHSTSNNYCQGKYRNNINNTVLYYIYYKF